MEHPTRRIVLKGATFVFVAPPFLDGCASLLNADGTIDAGYTSDYQPGDLVAVGAGVAVGLDSGGLYALSTVCTHAACDMDGSGSVSGSGLVCNCHGSRFDANGAVTRGPAGSPLPHFALTVASDGAISIDSSKTVASSDRTPV